MMTWDCVEAEDDVQLGVLGAWMDAQRSHIVACNKNQKVLQALPNTVIACHILLNMFMFTSSSVLAYTRCLFTKTLESCATSIK